MIKKALEQNNSAKKAEHPDDRASKSPAPVSIPGNLDKHVKSPTVITPVTAASETQTDSVGFSREGSLASNRSSSLQSTRETQSERQPAPAYTSQSVVSEVERKVEKRVEQVTSKLEAKSDEIAGRIGTQKAELAKASESQRGNSPLEKNLTAQVIEVDVKKNIEKSRESFGTLLHQLDNVLNSKALKGSPGINATVENIKNDVGSKVGGIKEDLQSKLSDFTGEIMKKEELRKTEGIGKTRESRTDPEKNHRYTSENINKIGGLDRNKGVGIDKIYGASHKHETKSGSSIREESKNTDISKPDKRDGIIRNENNILPGIQGKELSDKKSAYAGEAGRAIDDGLRQVKASSDMEKFKDTLKLARKKLKPLTGTPALPVEMPSNFQSLTFSKSQGGREKVGEVKLDSGSGRDISRTGNAQIHDVSLHKGAKKESTGNAQDFEMQQMIPEKNVLMRGIRENQGIHRNKENSVSKPVIDNHSEKAAPAHLKPDFMKPLEAGRIKMTPHVKSDEKPTLREEGGNLKNEKTRTALLQDQRSVKPTFSAPGNEMPVNQSAEIRQKAIVKPESEVEPGILKSRPVEQFAEIRERSTAKSVSERESLVLKTQPGGQGEKLRDSGISQTSSQNTRKENILTGIRTSDNAGIEPHDGRDMGHIKHNNAIKLQDNAEIAVVKQYINDEARKEVKAQNKVADSADNGVINFDRLHTASAGQVKSKDPESAFKLFESGHSFELVRGNLVNPVETSKDSSPNDKVKDALTSEKAGSASRLLQGAKELLKNETYLFSSPQKNRLPEALEPVSGNAADARKIFSEIAGPERMKLLEMATVSAVSETKEVASESIKRSVPSSTAPPDEKAGILSVSHKARVTQINPLQRKSFAESRSQQRESNSSVIPQNGSRQFDAIKAVDAASRITSYSDAVVNAFVMSGDLQTKSVSGPEKPRNDRIEQKSQLIDKISETEKKSQNEQDFGNSGSDLKESKALRDVPKASKAERLQDRAAEVQKQETLKLKKSLEGEEIIAKTVRESQLETKGEKEISATQTDQAVKNAATSIESVIKKSQSEAWTGDEMAAKLIYLLMKASSTFTFEHSSRVIEHSMKLAREMGITNDKELKNIEEGAMFHDIGEMELDLKDAPKNAQERLSKYLGVMDLKNCSFLHDIGKVKIPDSILYKPGRLTDEEFAILQKHPVIGEEILKPIPSMKHVLPVVRHHHEKWDGTGYPDSLKGEAIPMAARIVGITDAYDAMVSDRPYREGMPVQDAIAELKRNSGTQFDPRLVEAFLKIIDREEEI